MKTAPARQTGMRFSKKPWSTKLRPDMQPATVPDPKGKGLMLIPTPLLLAEEISRIPTGELLTVPALRQRLAARAGADVTCPLVTGIFYNIVAGAAAEQTAAGQTPLAPWWRVVLDDGSLSPKTPPGPEVQADLLRAEGHAITPVRSKLKVDGFPLPKNVRISLARPARDGGADS